MTRVNVKDLNIKTRLNLYKDVFSNLSTVNRDFSKSSIILTGDPGIGKTSFVHQMAELLGVKLVLIEVPHIIEEHLINVPFVVFDSSGKQSASGEASATIKNTNDDHYDVVLARSNLSSQIANSQQKTEHELLKHIYENPNLAALNDAMGGSPTELGWMIEEMRQKIHCILFIDEYWRKTSPHIRNILRGILNGNIGMDDIPHYTAVIYASNMSDTGLDSATSNAQFEYVEMPAPTKDEWFTWFLKKFTTDTKVTIDNAVVKCFFDALTDSDISTKDIESDVRTSPRRWEQILLYVNAALPVHSQKEVDHLLANVQSMFKHYETGAMAKIYKKVEKAVLNAVKITSGDAFVGAAAPAAEHDWRDTLSHQIAMIKKLGKHKTYVPVISGPPGIGKTRRAMEVAEENNLVYIPIDCSNFAADDVVGLPLPTGKGEDLGVDFTVPKLFMMVEKLRKICERHFLEHSTPEQKEEFAKSEWKYLLFLDELNRVKDENTFNAIRKILLDRKLNDQVKLPAGTIVVAAINPTDRGTIKLTGHMADVMDIIPSHASWDGYMESLTGDIAKKAAQYPDLTNVAKDIITKFAERFSDTKEEKIHLKSRKFYLAVGGASEPLYISPREYTQMFGSILSKLVFLTKEYEISAETMEDPSYKQEVLAELHRYLKSAIMGTVRNVLVRYDNMQAPGLEQIIHEWVYRLDPTKDLLVKRVILAGFQQIAEEYFENHEKDLAHEDELANYFDSHNHTEYGDDLRMFLDNKFESLRDLERNLLTDIAKRRQRLDSELIRLEEFVSRLEHFVTGLTHAIVILNINNKFLQTTGETFLIVFNKVADSFTELIQTMMTENDEMAAQKDEKGYTDEQIKEHDDDSSAKVVRVGMMINRVHQLIKQEQALVSTNA